MTNQDKKKDKFIEQGGKENQSGQHQQGDQPERPDRDQQGGGADPAQQNQMDPSRRSNIPGNPNTND